MTEFLSQHWKVILLTIIASNIVGAMPTPNGKGFYATQTYKWIFGTLHGILGGIPRILVLWLPQTAILFGMIPKGESKDEKVIPISTDSTSFKP